MSKYVSGEYGENELMVHRAKALVLCSDQLHQVLKEAIFASLESHGLLDSETEDYIEQVVEFSRLRRFDLRNYAMDDEREFTYDFLAAANSRYEVNPSEAKDFFTTWVASLKNRLELADPQPSETIDVALTGPRPIAAGYRPGTAFIMMWMSKDNPELTDVSETIKRCFSEFGIDAVRSDDIEHEDIITERILDQIKTAEFLFADLTGERPSVYYEVGFAHALGRRVILFRKADTQIHFDLSAYNCPEYENLSNLSSMLMKRLESLTGRPPRKKS